ncbi:MAG TPA: OmpA family protein [Prolixibacteraceae bacterium]|nr:OmpA family protein [Prolixibacteraceae bacterium]
MKQLTSFLALFLLITQSFGNLAEPLGNQQDQQESLKSYSKYDFVSGDKVIYYDDFSQDAVGDFPPNWFTDASGEVMTTNLFPGKWFMLANEGLFFPEKGVALPQNYTIEFDLLPIQEDEEAEIGIFQLAIYSSREDELYDMGGVPGNAGIEINMGSYFSYRSYDENKDLQNDLWNYALKANQVVRVSIWVQNSRLRLYSLGSKILDVPQGLTKGFKYNQIRLNTAEAGETRFLISNLRIAEAGSDQRSKFMTDGKLISYGILFDVNSDKVKPESYGALKEMADIMKENPDVKVKIVGHTDSDGDDAKNLDLSKRRAENVKAELVKTFDIDASRIETDGKGESEPIESNNTPLGKSKNRRVEFLKL